MVGREVAVEEVLAEVLRDRVFYEASGGGVTLSGGDPVMQPAFARALLAACKEAGLHTAIETCAHTTWDVLSRLLSVTTSSWWTSSRWTRSAIARPPG